MPAQPSHILDAPGSNSAAVDPAALAAHVRTTLGPAAVPKTWLTLDAVPLLPSGKTDRQALAAAFAAAASC
ncbi:MAG: hypothetical protein Q4G34_10995 [Micrococcus sp.]|nr:hypothetical protein [Micrococcus sp.]